MKAPGEVTRAGLSRLARLGRCGWIVLRCAALIAGLTFIYTANRVSIAAGDTVGTSAFTANIVQTGSIYFDALKHSARWPPDAYFAAPTPSGHLAMTYPIGGAVVYAPLHLPILFLTKSCRAEVFSPGFEPCRRHLDKLSAALLAGVSAVLFLLVLNMFAMSTLVRWSAWLFFALGSEQFVVSSQSDWQHGPTVFLSLVAMVVMFSDRRLRATVGGRVIDLTPAVLGFLLGFLVSVRPTNILLALPFAVWMISGRKAPTGSRAPATARLYLPFALGLAVGLFGIVWNVVIFDKLTGGYARALYPPVYVFSFGQFTEGLYGLLLSPGRGLIVYTPVVLVLCFIPFVWSKLAGDRDFRRLWPWLVSAIAIGASYCFYRIWWAGWTFGPRFFTDVMPVLILAAALVVDRARRRPLTAAFVVLGLVGVANQAAGAFGANGSYEGQQFDTFNYNDPSRAYFNWRDYPLRRNYLAIWLKITQRDAFFASDSAASKSTGCILEWSGSTVRVANTGDVAWIGFEGGSSDPPVVSAGGKNYPLRDAEVPPGSSGVFEDLSAGPMPSAGADRAGALSWGGRTLPIICPAS